MSSHSHLHARGPKRARGVPPSEWREQATARLAESGHRAGGARSAVVDLLAAEDCCLSAHEIFDALRAGGRRVGLASVYRALEVLLRLGLVARLDLGGGTARYEAARGAEHHHHVVCVECGGVSSFEDRDLERALEQVARRHDYAVDDHDVVLRGRCPVCRSD